MAAGKAQARRGVRAALAINLFAALERSGHGAEVAGPFDATGIGQTGSPSRAALYTREHEGGSRSARGDAPEIRQMRGRGPARLGSAAQTQGALHLVL
jgi:hypothetical protein